MKTSSAKAKARRVQNLVAGVFREIGIRLFQLKDGDVEPRPMGQAGVDVIFSPEAKNRFPFDIECKNVEKLNIVGEYNLHHRQYEKTNNVKLLVHGKNQSKTLVTLSLEDFFFLLFKSQMTLAEIHSIFTAVDGAKGSWEDVKRRFTESTIVKAE